MKIKIISFITLVITNSFCQAQQSNLYNIEKLGWTINIPDSFTNLNKETKKVHVVETKNKQTTEKSNITKEIAEEVHFQGKNYTYFLIFFKKNDSKNTQFSESDIKKHNNELIESLKKGKNEAQFESKITEEKIDGVNFYKTVLKENIGNNIFHNFIIYRTLLNGFEANFTIFYISQSSELEQLIKAFESSKFNT